MQRSIVETAEAGAARRCSGMRYIVPFTRSARRSSDAVHRNHSRRRRRRRRRSVPADLAVTDSVTDDRPTGCFYRTLQYDVAACRKRVSGLEGFRLLRLDSILSVAILP